MRIVVIGDLNLDLSVPAMHDVDAGGERRTEIHALPGGSAGTFARVAAQAGAAVTFVGAVGDDLLGEALVHSLEEAGIEARVRRSSRPTGVVLALWGAGERTMHCSRGANEDLTPDALDDVPLEDADHVHISGYALLSRGQRATARLAIDRARRAGLTCSVDPPPASLIASASVPSFVDGLAGVDWLFPNLDEGRMLTGACDPGAVAEALAERHAAGALTLGVDGALAWRGAERSRCAASAVADVDPTGAGDAYAAAFVVALLGGDGLDEANRRATRGAATFLARRLPSA